MQKDKLSYMNTESKEGELKLLAEKIVIQNTNDQNYPNTSIYDHLLQSSSTTTKKLVGTGFNLKVKSEWCSLVHTVSV